MEAGVSPLWTSGGIVRGRRQTAEALLGRRREGIQAWMDTAALEHASRTYLLLSPRLARARIAMRSLVSQKVVGTAVGGPRYVSGAFLSPAYLPSITDSPAPPPHPCLPTPRKQRGKEKLEREACRPAGERTHH